jgi:hypothetical protein
LKPCSINSPRQHFENYLRQPPEKMARACRINGTRVAVPSPEGIYTTDSLMHLSGTFMRDLLAQMGEGNIH